ncbi:unnamed protein product [Staurois parvus]|uniref:Uncharacterized protein n=1 Tax=Staurois parvus TaxID=386267 RepID=A0ABN9CXD5_9NEOB|nr:unnamed protein product [Staurois parvus]
MGPRTDSSCCCQARNLSWAPVPTSSCCCQARNLPWAPVPTPHAAARPVICHGGPLYRLLMLLPGPECVMGPCTASHCCCLHRHTLPCATSGLLTLLVDFPFCHRVLADYGHPIAAELPGP